MVMGNSLVSIWLWILWFKITSYIGIFDEPSHIWNIMSLTGMVCGVVFPRIIIIVFHFIGVAIRRKTGKVMRGMTNTGLVAGSLVLIIIFSGTLFGRFNFKTERIEIKLQGLKPDLNGLKIVLISDLHLSSFHHHKELMVDVMEKIKIENPDLLINTGDFISYGWREFGRFDTILRKAEGKYGKYAVMGNHDFGTYHPFYTKADKENNVLIINKLISSSGYKTLNDESSIITIGKSQISITGVTTRGSFPRIIHSDIRKAGSDTDSADLKILLAHDPNQWEKDVTGRTDIDLTLSGHTHGMQIGIYTKSLTWSPARYFYPNWSGLYRKEDQYLYVNRGLGVLGIPFRIWMPPEITVITLLAVKDRTKNW